MVKCSGPFGLLRTSIGATRPRRVPFQAVWALVGSSQLRLMHNSGSVWAKLPVSPAQISMSSSSA